MVSGRTVKVDTSSPAVTQLRERPSTYIQPDVRQERVINHVTVYHYQHPYDYYWGRPVGYGIGPYSNGFWWMMMEWNAQRRADWLYHNQARLSAEAYADGARDAAVQQRLAALEAQRVPRNVNYVDPEFASDPTDQYDQTYVEAAYNPTVMATQNSTAYNPTVLTPQSSTPYNPPAIPPQSRGGLSAGTVLLWLFGISAAVAVVYVFFNVRWGK
jgi:hypothetical protein